MSLPSKTYQQFVDDQVSAWAAALGFQPTLQDGDFLFALMQSVAGQLVFLQALATLVNAVARAQTSTGADLDSFFAQFGFTRLPGQQAEGPVVFSNPGPASSQVLIPVGTVVQTIGGAIQYAVIADTNQPTFNASLNAYVLQVGQTSLTASVQALEVGAASNVAANQLAQIGTPVPGINSVTNTVPITNGADAESDTAYRARFVLFLNSLSKATLAAITSAVQSVQQGIEFTIDENVDNSGATNPGEFVVTVDDGTGSPPASLVNAVFATINAVRGFTIMPLAQAVVTINVTVVIAVRLAAGANQGAVANAVVEAINSQGIGGALFVSTVEGAALATAGVAAVQPGTTLLNAANADLPPVKFHAYRSNVNIITVSTY
jgi:uncharacterized phage protein gp47/JayE